MVYAEVKIMKIKTFIIVLCTIALLTGGAFAVSNYGRNASIEGLGSGSGAVVYVVDGTGLLGQDAANLTYYSANQTLVVKLIKVQNISDSDNSAYYIDPENTGTSGVFAGAIKFGGIGGLFLGAPSGTGFRFNNNANTLNLVQIYDSGGVAIGTSGYADNAHDPGANNVIIKGNVSIGTTSFPSGGGMPVLVMAQAGSLPTGFVSNTAGMVVVDSGGTAEVYLCDEAGNCAIQTPHANSYLNNFSSEYYYPWVYESSNPYIGRRVVGDMEGLFRLVENLTGKQLLYTEEIPKLSWADLENWREQEENNRNRDAAVQAWLRNASEIEVLPSAAFEFVWDNKTVVTGKIKDYKNEYSFDENGAVSASVVPIYETKTISKEKRVLKNDVRFDKAVGKFYRKPTKAEAEVAVGEGYSHYLKQSPPAWMANRGAS